MCGIAGGAGNHGAHDGLPLYLRHIPPGRCFSERKLFAKSAKPPTHTKPLAGLEEVRLSSDSCLLSQRGIRRSDSSARNLLTECSLRPRNGALKIFNQPPRWSVLETRFSPPNA